MEDKHLEAILDEVKEAVQLLLSRYKRKNDPTYLDIGIELIDNTMKVIEGSNKKSASLTEFYHTIRGIRDELIDEKDRNSKDDIVGGSCCLGDIVL
jgi:lantibiotic modifying enzyme